MQARDVLVGVFVAMTGCASTGMSPGDKIPTAETQRCATDGMFGFRVSGDALVDFDGMAVSASVVEPHQDASNQTLITTRRPVLMSTTIQSGRFSLECPAALQETYAYPAWGLFIDVNEDGACNDDDVGLLMQRYGWNRAEDEQVGAGNSLGLAFQPVTTLPRSVGGTGSFCADFFP